MDPSIKAKLFKLADDLPWENRPYTPPSTWYGRAAEGIEESGTGQALPGAGFSAANRLPVLNRVLPALSKIPYLGRTMPFLATPLEKVNPWLAAAGAAAPLVTSAVRGQLPGYLDSVMGGYKQGIKNLLPNMGHFASTPVASLMGAGQTISDLASYKAPPNYTPQQLQQMAQAGRHTQPIAGTYKPPTPLPPVPPQASNFNPGQNKFNFTPSKSNQQPTGIPSIGNSNGKGMIANFKMPNAGGGQMGIASSLNNMKFGMLKTAFLPHWLSFFLDNLLAKKKEEKMRMKRVQSSNIASIGYKPSTKKMRVRFKNKSLYQYPGIKKEDFKGFENADSKGKFFHSNFRSLKKFKKLN